MILNWMIASAIFAGLVASAALLGERALAAMGRPRRHAWLAAIGVATAWPLVAGIWFLVKPAEEPLAIIRTRIGATAARAMSEQLAVAPSLGPIVERALIGAWLLVSALLIVRIVVALVRMRRVVEAAEPMRLDGAAVLLSDVAGPAVCGAINPRIVLPRWILELDAPLRAYVINHEREHVEKGDAATVLGAAMSVALVPWSPAVWMMSRRLRLAVELDCDARVLAGREPSDRYSRLLMLVAQRQTHARLQPMLAESSAHLERRISEMNTPQKPYARTRAAVFAAVASGAVLLAFSSPVMAGITKPAASPTKFGTEVLKLPAAKTTVQAPRTPTYTITLNPQGQGKTQPPPPPPKREYVEFTISKAAQQESNSVQPKYPDILKQAGVEGSVTVQFVVKPDSTVVASTMKVLNSSHPLFTEAVRNALPEMRYVAATVEGRVVRQLIEQHFEFRLADHGEAVEVVKGLKAEANVVHKPKTIVINGAAVTVKKP